MLKTSIVKTLFLLAAMRIQGQLLSLCLFSELFEPQFFSYRFDSLHAMSPWWESVSEWVRLCVFGAACEYDTL